MPVLAFSLSKWKKLKEVSKKLLESYRTSR
jgi:hypothetical protein